MVHRNSVIVTGTCTGVSVLPSGPVVQESPLVIKKQEGNRCFLYMHGYLTVPIVYLIDDLQPAYLVLRQRIFLLSIVIQGNDQFNNFYLPVSIKRVFA
jgi:hypothetical protein